MRPPTPRPLPSFELVLANGYTLPSPDEWRGARTVTAPDAADAAWQAARGATWSPVCVWIRRPGELAPRWVEVERMPASEVGR